MAGIELRRNIDERLPKVLEGFFQFTGADGLEEEGAAVEFVGFHGILRVSRDEDDVDGRPDRDQFSGQGQAVHVGQFDIQKCDIVFLVLRQLQGVFGVFRCVHRRVGKQLLHVPLHIVQYQPFVVRNQNLHPHILTLVSLL